MQLSKTESLTQPTGSGTTVCSDVGRVTLSNTGAPWQVGPLSRLVQEPPLLSSCGHSCLWPENHVHQPERCSLDFAPPKGPPHSVRLVFSCPHRDELGSPIPGHISLSQASSWLTQQQHQGCLLRSCNFPTLSLWMESTRTLDRSEVLLP